MVTKLVRPGDKSLVFLMSDEPRLYSRARLEQSKRAMKQKQLETTCLIMCRTLLLVPKVYLHRWF